MESQSIDDLKKQLDQIKNTFQSTLLKIQDYSNQSDANSEIIKERQNRIEELKNHTQGSKEKLVSSEETLKEKTNNASLSRIAINSDLYKKWKKLDDIHFQKKGEEMNAKTYFDILNTVKIEEETKAIENPEDVVKNFYDFIIDIDSLQAALQGWPYYVSFNQFFTFEQFHKKYDNKEEQKQFWKYLSEQKCLVGIIGMSNKGKSHLLGKINNMPVPTGFDVHTHGISFVKGNPEVNLKCDYIDSQGLGVAIQYGLNHNIQAVIDEIKQQVEKEKIQDLLTKVKVEDKTDLYKEKLAQYFNNLNQDRILTEQFLQMFMMEKCNILLIVVGIQTDYEQQLIIRLSKNHKDKTLIVVHNFSTLFTKDQVDQQIEKDIKNCYDCQFKQSYFKFKEENIPAFTYFDQTYQKDIDAQSSTKNPIIHLVYCREGTDPANIYNNGTIACIRANINQKSILPDDYISAFAALEEYFKKQFKSQFGQDFKFIFNQETKKFCFDAQNMSEFNEENFLEKIQNSHKMPLLNQDNEPIYTQSQIIHITEENGEYFKLSIKIDVSMIPNLRDQLNFLIDSQNGEEEIVDKEIDTYVLIKQSGINMQNYYLQIKLNRPKLQEIKNLEQQKKGFKEIHPMNFNKITFNKAIFKTGQINLGEKMPFEYNDGVLTLFLHCQNYEQLLDMSEIDEIDEEKGKEIIFIGEQ